MGSVTLEVPMSYVIRQHTGHETNTMGAGCNAILSPALLSGACFTPPLPREGLQCDRVPPGNEEEYSQVI